MQVYFVLEWGVLVHCIMRKYLQLLLVVVSLLSLVALLFYRHEYHRLRYVLQVLNFFGKPYPTSDSDCLSNLTLFGNLKALDDPFPSWQRLDPHFFVYSSHWDLSMGHVSALVVGDQAKPDFSCSLRFPGQTLEGQFSANVLFDSKDTQIAYYFVCKPEIRMHETPTHVFFGDYSLSLYNHMDAPTNGSAMCVLPGSSSLTESSVIEFLAFHNLIGFNKFIVYDLNLPPPLSALLRRPAMTERFGMQMAVLPWNYPFFPNPLLMKILMEADCLLRAKSHTRHTALLHWDEYIVPKYHSLMSDMLDDLGGAARFEIPVISFCENVPEIAETDPIRLLTRIYYGKQGDKELSSSRWIYSTGLGQEVQRISMGIATVHKLTSCTATSLSNHDPTVLRYATQLNRMPLLVAWKTERRKTRQHNLFKVERTWG